MGNEKRACVHVRYSGTVVMANVSGDLSSFSLQYFRPGGCPRADDAPRLPRENDFRVSLQFAR